MSTIARVALVVAVAAVAGCESSYIYRPSENATATMRGRVAARYQIPQANPTGDVRIASFGVAKVSPQNGQGELRAMHVRAVISNEGNQNWTFDTREQVADVHGVGQIKAGYARSDVGELPIENIGPGQKRTIDLFFPLPPGVDRARKLPEFDVSWRIQTAPGQVVAERTPFERLRIEPLYAGTAWGPPYAFGPFGWYDPLWGPGYIGAPSWYW